MNSKHHADLEQEVQFLRNFTKDPLTGFESRRIFFQFFTLRVESLLKNLFRGFITFRYRSLDDSFKRFLQLSPARAHAVISRAGNMDSVIAVGDFKVLSLFNQLGGHETGDYIIHRIAKIGKSLAHRFGLIPEQSYSENFAVLRWLTDRGACPHCVFARTGGDEIMLYTEGKWDSRVQIQKFFHEWNVRSGRIPDKRRKRRMGFEIPPGIDCCVVRLEEALHFFYEHKDEVKRTLRQTGLKKLFVNTWSDLADWGSFMMKSVSRLHELVGLQCSLKDSKKGQKEVEQRITRLLLVYGKSIFHLNIQTLRFFSQVICVPPRSWVSNSDRRVSRDLFVSSRAFRNAFRFFCEKAQREGIRGQEAQKKAFLEYVIEEFIFSQGTFAEHTSLGQGYEGLSRSIRKQSLVFVKNYLESSLLGRDA